MTFRNTTQRYGIVAAGFHWVTALFVLGLVAVGLYVAYFLKPGPEMFKLLFWHKSFGIAVLALVILRVLWRFVNVKPAPLATHKQWEKTLARIVHGLLYAALFVMPLSGWIMSSAKGFKVSVFGWFSLPDLVGPSKEIAQAAVLIHQVSAYALIVIIGLHAAGALKHFVIDRDGTLARMVPFLRLCFVLALLVPVSALAADPVKWTIDPAASTLTFEGTQMGASFTGTFAGFDGDILFDPANLAASRVAIKIKMEGAATGSPDRDSSIGGPDWFDAASFPESEFRAEKFDDLKDGKYVAHGTLTVRGVGVPLDLPFTLEIAPDGKTAKAKGETVLNRFDFGVGKDWTDESSVGSKVTVRFDLTAAAAPAQ